MSFRRLLPALAALAVLPSSAAAAPVTIDGSPLNVTMDEYGALQARFDDAPNGLGEFFSPSSEVTSAGFQVVIYDDQGFNNLYGPAGNRGTPLDANADDNPDGPILSSNGNTQTLATSYTVGQNDELRVDIALSYTNGERQFSVRHNVTNTSGAPVRFSGAEYADLYFGGSDSGVGFLDEGPPRIVGGANQLTGAGGGIVEMSPQWAAYEANNLGDVSNNLRGDNGPQFSGTIVTEQVDNAAGVQWDNFKASGLAQGQSTSYDLGWRFDQFDVPPPPPVAFQSVNVDPEGVVRIKPPPGQTIPGTEGTTARAAGASRFVRVTRAVQIPVGSVVDTKRGSIGMTSAANTSGATQTGTFEEGRFRVVQPFSSRPITELRMTGGNFGSCTRNVGNRSSARTAARRIRRLRGNARGRFRTRGRNSSATVRGTDWGMIDQCNGTLTRVRSGVVRVRDFAKNRTVTLRRGRSYLARPKRR